VPDGIKRKGSNNVYPPLILEDLSYLSMVLCVGIDVYCAVDAQCSYIDT
jgi:hypothetical protein